jgi:Amt family ammonium transporter
MLAGCTGTLGALLYMWSLKGKPDASMTGNGLLAGLVAITAPSGFVSPVNSCIIGLIAGVLVCISVAFVENKLKVDDPVGAISVHGTNGLWGVLSVGLFADGTSNYGGSWNGVNGSVTGLFYGDASQLAAQLVGISTLLGFVFTFSFVMNWALEYFVGHRVSAESEIAGLDIPEMGQLGYPEFVFRAEPEFASRAHAEVLAVASVA